MSPTARSRRAGPVHGLRPLHAARLEFPGATATDAGYHSAPLSCTGPRNEMRADRNEKNPSSLQPRRGREVHARRWNRAILRPENRNTAHVHGLPILRAGPPALPSTPRLRAICGPQHPCAAVATGEIRRHGPHRWSLGRNS